MKTLAFALLLLATPAFAQGAAQILTVDAPTGVTTCEVEQSLNNGTTWTAMATRATPSTGSNPQCTFTVTPPTGRTLYRWAYFVGTTRVLRTDAGLYLCVGLADCPPPPTNVGVR